MAYIYRHIRLDKNEPFYIGASKRDFNEKTPTRANEKKARNNIWKQIVLTTDYEIEIILSDLKDTEVYEKEKEFIKLYGRLDNGTGTLANKNDGGAGNNGTIYTAERRKKISEMSKKNGISKATREKMASKLRGRPQPQWQRDILSKAAIGKKVTWCHVPIIQYSMNMDFIKEFESIASAAKELNLSNANICSVLKNKRNHTGKFFFKYKNNINN